MKTVSLIEIPFDLGASQRGCRMGPDAFAVAGMSENLEELGVKIARRERLGVESLEPMDHPNSAIHHLAENAAWTAKIASAGVAAAKDSVPIFLGGDHALAAGSVSGMARAAKEAGKKFYVLWLDAHSDFHSLDTTGSGNLHGTPVAYYTGQSGFDPYYPELQERVDPQNVCMMGIRSVDALEHNRLIEAGVIVNDMRKIDEFGMVQLLKEFLEIVVANDGWLHVSLDVDFLDPEIAPAVGTTVAGGATYREAHLIMEMLCESDLVRSLDLVELNPFLDEKGRTAKLLVDLTASLFGRRVIDRMTKSY